MAVVTNSVRPVSGTSALSRTSVQSMSKPVMVFLFGSAESPFDGTGFLGPHGKAVFVHVRVYDLVDFTLQAFGGFLDIKLLFWRSLCRWCK